MAWSGSIFIGFWWEMRHLKASVEGFLTAQLPSKSDKYWPTWGHQNYLSIIFRYCHFSGFHLTGTHRHTFDARKRDFEWHQNMYPSKPQPRIRSVKKFEFFWKFSKFIFSKNTHTKMTLILQKMIGFKNRCRITSSFDWKANKILSPCGFLFPSSFYKFLPNSFYHNFENFGLPSPRLKHSHNLPVLTKFLAFSL